MMDIPGLLRRLRGASDPRIAPPGRLHFDEQPPVLYAIGDVHGCLAQLRGLEAEIVADARTIAAEPWLVMLGDLVDRGPSSAQVIDHMLAPPPPGFRRFCLRGNHEAMMLEFLLRPQARSNWLEFGGRETLLSYGAPGSVLSRELTGRDLEAIVASCVPAEHFAFLQSLPVLLETPETLLVHAGLQPGVAVADQADADLIWFRDDFAADYASVGKTVVHGHTPREEPLVSPHRIAIDTGAYLTGRLTAVRLRPGAPPQLFSTGRRTASPAS